MTQGAWALSGSGTSSNPYQINSYNDWISFCQGSWGTAYIKLNCDVSGTTYIPSTTFQGNFDGNGHQISRGSGAAGTPIFPAVNGATIKNLVIGGSFSFSSTKMGALIGTSTGNTTVENCRVGANATYNITGVNSGTIVGYANGGSLTMRGCVFAGSITAPNGFTDFGGLIAKNSSATATIQNCVVNPSSVKGTPSIYNDHFSRGGGSLSNNYYLCEPTAYIASGSSNLDVNLKARSISAANSDVTISGLGTAMATYNVSGITAYSKGIKYNSVYYAGNGQSVSLTLSHADKTGYTFSAYTASAGTLSGTTLTMPNPTLTL
ncbi:MAG: hypothetical protein IJV06_01120 [Bacteroidaceae bacterium]|nr:hypothetical protein [Bacteroidaceae bacterium]